MAVLTRIGYVLLLLLLMDVKISLRLQSLQRVGLF